MMQSTLFENEIIADAEFEIINNNEHIRVVWDTILPALKRSISRYISHILAEGSAEKYIRELIRKFQAEQNNYYSFFMPGWDKIGEDFKEFKKRVRLHCPAFLHALQAKTRVLNDWKAEFNTAEPKKLYHVIKNIYNFSTSYGEIMTEDKIANISCWEDNKLLDLVDTGCYLNKVIGPGVESALLYHLNPRIFPGVYKFGIFSLYFLSGRGPIEMPSETSEFIMVKDAIRSRTGIIESDHNYFFPYQVYAYYTLKIYWTLCDSIKKRFSVQFPNGWRYVLTSDFFSMIINENHGMLQTLMGNDDILKFKILEYY